MVGARSSLANSRRPVGGARLDRGWIIANHKLVSFHAAFLTSLVSISPDVATRADVVREMFLSAEVVLSALFWYLAWHTNIAVHEMGHNVEQVFSVSTIDHTLLQGVPNTAFTEAMAFVFQSRDLELLGLGKPDPKDETCASSASTGPPARSPR